MRVFYLLFMGEVIDMCAKEGAILETEEVEKILALLSHLKREED